jgi:hypothetical protein
MKQYLIPQPMATDETLIGLYARTAPETMPEWYKLKVINPRNNIISEQMYFQWRLYYANKMIELLNKK